MTSRRLAVLKFVALLFLLPGLAGLIVSALISTHYLDTLPRRPEADQYRVVPRSIHGTIVYQTDEENSFLNRMEYSSVAIFAVGLAIGLVYLEKWGSLQPADEREPHDRPFLKPAN